MSRRKNRSHEHGRPSSTSPVVADAVSDAAAPVNSGTVQRANRLGGRAVPGSLMAVFVIAGLWIVGLMVLALLTANPVTINVQQIVRSDYVITAEFPTAPAGTLIAEKEWKHGADLRTIPVENLSHVVADPGRRYIIPLSRIGEGTYRVTPARLPGDPPLVYPATSDTQQQLRDLLSH